jgi:hypothetical protein
MAAEFDPNDVAAKAAVEMITNSARAFEAQMRKALQFVNLSVGKGFREYCANALAHQLNVRTIIHRSEPVHLDSIYANLTLSSESSTIKDSELIDFLTEKRFVIVTGTAGCGKSFLQKYLLSQMFAKETKKIPALIELRSLESSLSSSQQIATVNFEAMVLNHLTSFGLSIEPEVLHTLMQRGAFALLLDGFDELTPRGRQVVEAGVIEFLKYNRSNWIVLTSRPDERFGGWPHFAHFSVNRLTRADAIRVVQKLEIDEQIKQGFTDLIGNQQSDFREELISIPLFVYICLLVFRDFSNIPAKTILFYRYAFDTLYSKHDALKVNFTRPKYTNLEIDEMERLIGCFCFITYMNQKYSFTESEVLKYARESIDATRVHVKPTELESDMKDWLCLLHRDGLKITFSHRSFQEYFTATYLTSEIDDFGDTLDWIDASFPSSQVIEMVDALAAPKVDKEWLEPSVKALRELLGDALADDNKYIELCAFQFVASHDTLSFEETNGRYRKARSFLKHFTDELPPSFGDVARLVGEKAARQIRSKLLSVEDSVIAMRDLKQDKRHDKLHSVERKGVPIEPGDRAFLAAEGILPIVHAHQNYVRKALESLDQRLLSRKSSQSAVMKLVGRPRPEAKPQAD